MKSNRLVYGIGINDADYNVQLKEIVGYKANGKPIEKQIWACPFYRKWFSMFNRCYSEKTIKNRPSYIGCTIVSEWHYFMTFRSWMIQQDWKGKHLDKDVLILGNKVYGPETCVFVDGRVNGFITDRKSSRGEWPIGVRLDKRYNVFCAQCHDVLLGKQRHLGSFKDPEEEAHKAWLNFKLEQARILASEQTDERVAKALIARYENYEE